MSRVSSPSATNEKHRLVASSSTSSSSSNQAAPRTLSQLGKDVYNLVDQVRQNPRDASILGRLIPAALDYVKNEKGKKNHYFCAKEGQPEVELHTCMLRVLSFKTGQEIAEWLRLLSKQIFACIDCYKAYTLAKETLSQSYLKGFSEANVEKFLTYVDAWEEEVALGLFSSRKVKPGDGLGFLAPAELYAVLSVSALRDEIRQTVKETMTPHKLAVTLRDTPMAGIIKMALEDDEKAQKWAVTQLRSDPKPRPLSGNLCKTRSVRKVLAQIVEELAASPLPDRAKHFWSCISIVRDSAPMALGLLSQLVFSHLYDTGDHFPQLLQALDGVFKAKGPAVWQEVIFDDKKKDEEYPLVVLASILDNPTFFDCLGKATEKEAAIYTAWMRSLLASLRPASTTNNQTQIKSEDGTSTHRRQDTPPSDGSLHSGVYADVLKRLCNFLLERMQQGRVRMVALQEGLSMIIDCYESVDDLTSAGFHTISQVVGLYARTITTLALRGQTPASTEILPFDHPCRVKARDVVAMMLEADQAILVDALHHLSELSQLHSFRWKQRRKPGQLKAEELYAQASKEPYPSPNICTELWTNAYQSFTSMGSAKDVAEAVGIFLRPLSKLALYDSPAYPSHLLPAPATESKAYADYKQTVRSCIASLNRRLRSVRGELPELLAELSEAGMSGSSQQSSLQEQCVQLAEELMIMNLSPVDDTHKAAQNVVRAAYSQVEGRADVFRALLSGSTAALKGVHTSLEQFITACHKLVEANDAAKWMVRSGADIIEVLCNRTSGLLLPGAEHSLVDRGKADKQVLEEQLPAIWEAMCQSIAVVFQKTPKWSEHISREDMVAWFRDVTIFASQLTEQYKTVQRAANARRRGDRKQGHIPSDEEEEVNEFIVSCLALPLEQTISWLRINDLEIVAETMDYISKALQCFDDNNRLPAETAEKMLRFVKEQIEVENPDDRKTLLSTNALLDLQARLDPSSAKVVEISDDEDEVQFLGSSKDRTASPTSSQQSWLASMTPTKKTSAEAASQERKRKLKQQRLSFPMQKTIDVDALPEKVRLPPKPVPALAPTVPPPSANKYQSAARNGSATQVARKAIPARPANANMAALRKGFAAVHRPVVPNNVNRRLPANNADMRLPQAPAASSSVTGAAGSRLPSRPSDAKRKDSDDESDSSDDEDDGQPTGLAALDHAKRSPTKLKAPVAVQQPRKTKLLDDGGIEKARKERMEAERKRLLRAPTDLSNLHASILKWDWYHVGNRPPAASDRQPPQYLTVPAKFTDSEQYVAVFGPLLMLESWAQFQSAKQDYMEGRIPMYTCEVSGRVNVDSFVDVSATMSPQTPRTYRLGDSDIVVLKQRSDALVPDPRPSKDRILLAKVEQFKMHPAGSNLTLRCCLDSDTQGISSQLVNKSQWEIGCLFNLNTLNREFSALLTAQYFDLSRDIFQAKLAPRHRATANDVQMMRDVYGVNEPQAEAILGALGSSGFSLIQGPPGTGKTKTICSLVAHFVATRKTPANIGTGGRAAPIAIAKKLLICAPSNAAIDEVARRAKLGMKGPDGKHIKVNVVRIGRDDKLNVATKDISLDYLVDQALAQTSGESSDGPSIDQLHLELRSIRDERERKQAELEEARKGSNTSKIQHLETELRGLTSKRMTASQKLDEQKDKRQTASRKMDADRRKVRSEILLNADVVCSTLAGAGQEALASLPIDFETVIIDEAAQAVELSTLIPLRYGAKRCILVGDPNQLPPTVISDEAERFKYSQSLFVRLYQQAQDRVYLLSIQYRMHPEISAHPSQTFYGGKLLDGPNMAQLTAQPWHQDALLKPFRLFSVEDGEEKKRGNSFFNTREAQTAVSIYDRLKRAGGINQDFDGRVGCVTMYKGQVQELKRVFASRYGPDIDQRIDFNTVDGFQGQEKDVIILSCVRTGNTLGFTKDARRINVAITRAKSNLFIVGHAAKLKAAPDQTGLWRGLVTQAETRRAVQIVASGTFNAPLYQSGNTPTKPLAATSAVRRLTPTGPKKDGRARPAGWIAHDEAARKRTKSPAEEGELSPVKKLRVDSPLGGTLPPSPSSSRPPPARPAGLQTMRPPAASPGNIAGLQTRRPGPASSQPAARPPAPHGGLNGDSASLARPPQPPRPSGPISNGQRPHPRPLGGAMQPRPARPPQPRPAPQQGPNTAALDAMFVKKRKK